MNRIFLSLVLLGVISISVLSQQQVLTLWENQLRGLRNDKLFQNIGNEEFQDIQNVYTDKDYCAQVCEGTDLVWLTSGSVRYAWEYTKSDGNRYLIFVDSTCLNYTKIIGDYSTLVDTVTLNANVWGVSLLDYFHCGDYSGDRWRFDGSTLYRSTEIPQGKYALSAYGKIYVANINTTGQKSCVYYCKIGDPNNFPELFYVDVNPNDGEEITGIFLCRGEIIVTKRHSTHKLLNVDNDDNTDDSWITITNEIGCVSGNTVRELHNNWIWVTETGIVKYNGVNFEFISQPIDSTIANMAELNSGQGHWTETTNLQFGAGGYFLNVSTTNHAIYYNFITTAGKVGTTSYQSTESVKSLVYSFA